MSHLGSIASRLRSIAALGLLALVLAVLVPPAVTRAHPLDEYLQLTYLTVAPTQIEVELDLTPGVLIDPEILAEIDTNGDHAISDAETGAYADTVVRSVELKVDGHPLALDISTVHMPAYLNIQAGYGTIRIVATATLADSTPGSHRISYTNRFAPTSSVY